ncbi:MAG: hypothetical protein CL608_28735 [Anaerolineaceae bacterium]|nr:hypothetical protein [Anaerolineaceae bacterium]
MPTKKVSFTQLTHDVVYKSPEPLPFAEIMARVNGIAPITTKNPKNTIRNAVSQSHMIVSTGDGRFDWKPRVINGSLIRHTIQTAELHQNRLYWDEDLRDALCPTFFAPQTYKDRSPAQVTCPNGTTTAFSLEMFAPRIWGTPAVPEFWEWFHSMKAHSGDHLLFEVVDGEARQYRLIFQHRSDRDETMIATRNQELVAIGLKLVQQRPYGISSWDFTTYLLATGFYRHPVPPDPFSELWHEVLYGEESDSAQSEPDPLATELFGEAAQEYNFENPPNLPREYDPRYGRRHTRQSRSARSRSITSFLLRVNHRALPEVWRDIELAEDNNLEDLHLLI